MTSMVSVVIPVYNHARYLEQAVRSALSQDYEPLEVVIVDDGSTDGSPAIAQQLCADARVRYIRQINGGPAAARNRGIRESRGEWVAFLDADDYWLPGKLGAQLETAEKDRSNFIFCGTLVVNDQGETLATRPAPRLSDPLLMWIWGNQVATPTVLIRKKLLTTLGGFDETLRIGEDWDLWLRLATASDVSSVPAPLVAVRHSEWAAKGHTVFGLEKAVIPILRRLFSSIQPPSPHQRILRKRRLIMSWHYSIIAKSYLKRGQLLLGLRSALRAVCSHPRGLAFLLPSGKESMTRRWGSPVP